MWGFCCFNGHKFSPKTGEEEYGEPCSTGDVIGVHLNFEGEVANLSLTKNGNSLGVAFDDLQGPVYPAVCMLHVQSQVTLSYKN
mmetsp:Transcript_29241/g.5278  ORF Transcript_29241/g.5278 Transcript_29241/m.5278 type:complete len:84 (+) Transcript_29241:583-834(+)|eukprot:CAMPEP_0168315188 /NCGR_PEP_ID=MMETSP0210-20121227/10415_1 /TAXON_ID=40633 /ORGANISM="Condylostoma magnum, Strain COL2" /LENGTH=83 /DNA_ID=CAMNT_0008286943 /DNA_START=594 /DNA_END=845 /DNA_ORIENTATION=-